MTETLKPGTRCECPEALHAHWNPSMHRTREAVRMVRVPDTERDHGAEPVRYLSIPMCAACASFHEKRAK